MTHCRFFRAIVLWTIVLCASSVAAQDPVIYTDDRARSSTFRDRGTSYAPTYLVYADTQRTADDAKQLIETLGLPAHLEEYIDRAALPTPHLNVIKRPECRGEPIQIPATNSGGAALKYERHFHVTTSCFQSFHS